MAQADNPRQAQAIVGEALQETLDNIHTTIQALNSDDLDYLDLWPLHEQLYARDPWSQPFYRWVADQETEGHQRAEFWINVGLSSLAAIGFLIANLATFGTATFFIAAGVGVAAGGYQVGRNWERYFDLAAARGSSTSEETELVTGSQVNAELAASIIDSVMLFLAVASTAGRGFSARGGGPRTPGRPGGGGGTGGGGRNLMQLARKAVTRRVESFKQRLMNALRGHNWADEPLKSLEDAEAAIEKLFQQQSREAARIGSGTSRALAGEIGGELTEAQRQTLVAEYMRDLRAWREAALNRAHLNFAKHSLVKGSAGSGYGSRGLGHPPARRPPSGHHGGGWESGW